MEENSLLQIRKELERSVGKRVVLKANKGRNKIIVKEGILESAYPSLFVVKVSNDYDSVRRVSYTYSDILTSTVEIRLCDIQDQEKIS